MEKKDKDITPVVAHLLGALISYYLYEGEEDKAQQVINLIKGLSKMFE